MASEIVKKTLVHVIFFLYVLCTIYINCLSDANVVWIDGNQRLTISFYLQLNPLLNVTDTYDIFSIQNAQTGSHVATLWCTRTLNENQFVNDSGFSDLFQFCDYTVPSGYDYSFETEWVQLYLQRVSKGDGQSYGVRKQFPECRDSDHAFWDSDDSTAYLSDIGKKRDIYTKIFECNSFNQVMQDHRWISTHRMLNY
eukprot:197107_1